MIVLVVYVGLLGLTGWRVATAPTGFIPTQDQGYLLVNVQLPDSASVQRTDAILARLDQIARRIPGVAHTVGVSGESFLTTTNGPNLGTMFLGLKPFEQRTAAEYDEVIARQMQQQCNQEYVNQFNKFGRTWQVNIQAEPSSRTSADILKQLYVRSSPKQGQGQMIPLGTLVRAENSTGPLSVMRYNMYTSASINGIPAPGVSSGTVVQEMTRLAGELDVPFEWTEMTYLQVKAGNIALLIFGLGTVLVYLVLAAKYESWRLPLAVILVVPLCLLAAVTGMAIARLPVDIFVQIGFLVLVALASKNAILIVEFANERQQQGAELHEAARGAAEVRFRPILMTSLAFIGGVYPLVVATGAGAEMRQSLGTAVFSGMIGVTLFGIFLTPVFFFVLTWFGSHQQPGTALVVQPGASPVDAAGTTRGPAAALPTTESLHSAEDAAAGNRRAPTGRDGRDGPER